MCPELFTVPAECTTTTKAPKQKCAFVFKKKQGGRAERAVNGAETGRVDHRRCRGSVLCRSLRAVARTWHVTINSMGNWWRILNRPNVI